LELQNRVAREVARGQAALAQITDAQTQAMRGLLARSGPPFWSQEFWARTRPEGFTNVHTAIEWWRAVVIQLRDPATGLTAHAWLFVILSALLWEARRWTRRSVNNASFATAVFDRPFSAAVLMSFISHPLVYGVAPPELQQVFQL